MIESGDSSSHLKTEEAPPPLPSELRRRRRRRCIAWTCCGLFITLVLLALLILILALTVFKSRDPTTTLVSATVDGISPRVSLPAVRVELNVTLDLDLLVHNPNRASFSHYGGRTVIFYQGTQVGDADMAPGRIPSRGSAHVYSRLTLEADRFAEHLGNLISDILGGRVVIDSSTRMPGRITFLGFIKHHAVTLSDCRVVIQFPRLSVVEQECRRETKL